MSEKNVLLTMTLEKNRMIHEMISRYLGHEPSPEEKKEFSIMHRLGESTIYHKGKLLGFVRNAAVDEPVC
jgi:hypothetical protein